MGALPDRRLLAARCSASILHLSARAAGLARPYLGGRCCFLHAAVTCLLHSIDASDHQRPSLWRCSQLPSPFELVSVCRPPSPSHPLPPLTHPVPTRQYVILARLPNCNVRTVLLSARIRARCRQYQKPYEPVLFAGSLDPPCVLLPLLRNHGGTAIASSAQAGSVVKSPTTAFWHAVA